MTANLPPERDTRDGGRAASTWGRDGKSDPIARYVAPALGCTPKTACHRMRAVSREYAAFIRAFLALGDHERLARFTAEAKAAEAGLAAPALTDALERAAVQHAHEFVEATLLLEQQDTPAHRRLLVRAIDREIAQLMQMRAAATREAM